MIDIGDKILINGMATEVIKIFPDYVVVLYMGYEYDVMIDNLSWNDGEFAYEIL